MLNFLIRKKKEPEFQNIFCQPLPYFIHTLILIDISHYNMILLVFNEFLEKYCRLSNYANWHQETVENFWHQPKTIVFYT